MKLCIVYNHYIKNLINKSEDDVTNLKPKFNKKKIKDEEGQVTDTSNIEYVATFFHGTLFQRDIIPWDTLLFQKDVVPREHCFKETIFDCAHNIFFFK